MTSSFKETVKARIERDAAFEAALLAEAFQQMLAGDREVGEAVLRNYFDTLRR
jgi:hypothetical protein